MNTKARSVLILALVLLAGAALVAVIWAAPGHAPLSPGGAPTVVAYQGEVRVSGAPYTGNGYFKFAVVNAAGDTAYWSNDGTSAGGGEPTAAVQLAVSQGLFNVLLGDTTLGGMTQALTADVFSQPDRYLRVWFSSDNITFSQLTPDTRIAAVPYALQAQEAVDADTVDGLHASELRTHYQNVVVVAKSGGDYTSVQAAIDSIADAAADNAYLVWVAPGVYSETVTMKPYVHLQGAGQEATVITSTTSDSAWPPTQATLVLASDTSLRDLTVGNGGAGEANVALLATAGMTRTLVANVTARAQGDGLENYPIVLSGSGTGVTLQQVTALAENGSSHNIGLVNISGAAVVLRGGSFTGRGGANAWGILNANSATTLEAVDVTALGENGSNSNFGLYNRNGAAAVVRGGSFTGRGGANAWGINNADNDTTLEADNVTALAENGSSNNFGLENSGGAAVVLRGGSFTGSGGTSAYGIFSSGITTTLEADSVTALGRNSSGLNYGMENYNGGVATLRGGSFTGSGGNQASGVQNTLNSTLAAEGITALAENSSTENYGLFSYNGVTTTLRGGAFTGRGGTSAYGIYNSDSGATLEADSVTALGENGTFNYGLHNYNAVAATLRGGAFTGRGGTSAYGIYNSDSGATLEADSVTALGEDGSSNYGLYNDASATATADSSQFTGSSNGLYLNGGTVYLGVSQLDGGATRTTGSLTCFQVYDGSYTAYTCP
jgi:hypothetical protein